PATASRLAFTVCGHAAQYMFFTARVMVFSAAKAAEEPTTQRTRAVEASSLVIGILRHESRNRGARKSNPSAATTRIVARMSPVLTSLFGSGRAHASPSAQASFVDR